MSLFVVQHRHEANRCAAGDPKMAQMLLKHPSPQSTKSYGLTIRADRQAVALGALRRQVLEEHLCHFRVAGRAAIGLVAVLNDEQAHGPFLLCSHPGLSYRMHRSDERRYIQYSRAGRSL